MHPPVVDEYYFWLQDARHFSADGETQNADQGVNPADPTSDWHDPAELPGLLHWESEPMVLLLWCRVHNGELKQPRRSDEGVRVHCRLTLLSSTTRVDPRLADPPVRCCDDPGCTDGYHALPNDTRIRKAYAATEAIATSSGQNDAGLFELSFRDERYLPFELAGAVSRWRIELPQENNQWSLDTLGDFVVHLNYTAREGGDALRRAAGKRAQRHLPGGGVRLFDVRHELPDAWHAFQGGGASRGRLSLRLHRGMFPFVPGRGRVAVHRFDLFFEAKGATPSASHVVEFLVGDHGHSHGAECDCERRFVTCVASSEWPDVFHGAIEIDPRRVGDDRPKDFGVLRFPPEAGAIEAAYLLLGYRIE